MNHDPLCPFAEWPDESCYQPDAGVTICSVIRATRKDEATRAHRMSEAYRRGLRDAVDAVKALCDCPVLDGKHASFCSIQDVLPAVAAIEALGGESRGVDD